MRTFINAGLVLLLSCGLLCAQADLRKRSYMQRGVVRHHVDSATVLANDPRPLSQAITAVSEEYGWVVHFEEPPYQSNLELVDDTAPQWRAAHPNVKGVRIAAGGAFHTEYPEKPNLATSAAEEERVLKKIVMDCNQSGNPGKYGLRRLPDDSFLIAGTSVKDDTGADVPVSAILDTPISFPGETRSVAQTITLITRELSEATGIRVLMGTMPINLFFQSQVAIGGENVPARSLLQQALAGTKRQLHWVLYYDPDRPSYGLNVLFAQLVGYDSSGNRTTTPIDRLPDKQTPKRPAASKNL